ncbi:MAG: outer membrane protein assembly factor BamD [Candidatus Hydrogenedens sp.]|nr:outer membrane protein assembly factor BamD [Candidatus Hydrogenedens sp.]
MLARFCCLVLGAAALLAAAAPAHAQWVWTPQTGRFINLDRMPKETAELQVEYARTLLLEGNPRKAFRETDKFIRFYDQSDFADDNQFLRGEILMAMGRAKGAAEEFQKVIANYPDTELYSQAIEKQYEIADHYYEQGLERIDDRWRLLFRKRPLKRAIDVYGMVIDNQPFTPQAAEAQYKVGLCHYAAKDYLEAAFEYRRVVEDYGTSEYVADASYGLTQCYYDMSFPPEYDQSPSKLAIESIDSFQRRFPDDPRTADLTPKRDEMREKIADQRLLNAQYYERRQKFAAARVYYEGIVRDYAGTAAATEAEAWLSENPDVFSLEEKYEGRTRRTL